MITIVVMEMITIIMAIIIKGDLADSDRGFLTRELWAFLSIRSPSISTILPINCNRAILVLNLRFSENIRRKHQHNPANCVMMLLNPRMWQNLSQLGKLEKSDSCLCHWHLHNLNNPYTWLWSVSTGWPSRWLGSSCCPPRSPPWRWWSISSTTTIIISVTLLGFSTSLGHSLHQLGIRLVRFTVVCEDGGDLVRSCVCRKGL